MRYPPDEHWYITERVVAAETLRKAQHQFDTRGIIQVVHYHAKSEVCDPPAQHKTIDRRVDNVAGEQEAGDTGVGSDSVVGDIVTGPTNDDAE